MKFNEALIAFQYDREKKFALIGNESFLKDYFVQKVRALFKGDCLEFFPEQEQEALDNISSGTLFSKNLIILRDFDKMDVSLFEGFEGTFVFITSEKPNLKSRSITNILSRCTSVECNKFKEYGAEYPVWIGSVIGDWGYKAQEGVSQLLYHKIGPNMHSLYHELEKLFLIKTDKMIVKEDIEKYVSILAASTSFDLFESLIKKDVKKALIDFDSFTRLQDNFIDVVGFLAVYLEKMYRVLLLHEKKMDAKDIADIVGIPSFILKTKYLSSVLSLGRAFIASRMESLCVVDASLRSFRGNKRIVMERYFLSFQS